MVDHAAILAQLDRDARAFDLREVAYDRWGATQLVQGLQDAGLTVVPFGQGFSSMSGPTKEFERLVLDRRDVHGANSVMTWMVDNLVVKTDPAGSIKLDLQRSTDKIDSAIAAVMALDRALRHAHRPRSSEDRDLEVV